MCSKPTRSSLRLRSKKRNTHTLTTKKPITSTSTTKRASSKKTKTKTKTRKHKYISLQRDLSYNDSSTTNSSPDDESAEQTHHHYNYHQEQVEVPELLNLFKEEEKEENINNVVAYNFFDCTQETTGLNGLIGCTADQEGNNNNNNSSVCPSVTYGGYSDGGTRTTTTSLSLELEKSALRGGEREVREEKWVCYEEVTSCTVPSSEYGKKVIKMENGGGDEESGRKIRRRLFLSLKLDYDQIMNAWSNKGPLYINHNHAGSDESQIVPNLQLDDILGCQDSTTNNVFLNVGNVPLLRVPEDGDSVMDNTDGEVWKLAHREARVLRYKEKRQNRLFSKRIRYEVRKLNAEKRPRIKGRFVKRS